MIKGLLLMLALLSAHASTDSSIIEEGSHCVAYKVEKTMFFFKNGSVVGRNCDVSAQVLPEVGGLYHIEVNIPIRSFNSGDPDRDKDVVKILRGEQKPELTFRSKAFTADQWKDLFAKKSFALDGELSIGDTSFPLSLNVEYSEKPGLAEVHGEAKVRFEDFQLRPPKVGGGVVAKSKPEFELFFNLVSSRILGADSIRLAKQPGAKVEKQ